MGRESRLNSFRNEFDSHGTDREFVPKRVRIRVGWSAAYLDSTPDTVSSAMATPIRLSPAMSPELTGTM